jgi:two-component system nitrogen regulation sensor histidine kinase NtrY
MLRVVSENLVANAIRYAGAGTVCRVSVTRVGDQSLLAVEDTGIGVDPGDLSRLFERFYRADTARSSRGTGLGLAIVKKIIEEHFGTIGFTDRPGGGTIVTICFDSELLANMVGDANADADGAEPRPAALTRTGNTKS